jgi:hypothetical protein
MAVEYNISKIEYAQDSTIVFGEEILDNTQQTVKSSTAIENNCI